MRRIVGFIALAVVAGCGSSGAAPGSPAPAPAESRPMVGEHALAGLAAQRIIVLPVYAVAMDPGLNWRIPGPTNVTRALDAEIVSALDERSMRRAWTLPPDLEQSYRRNASYATDPYALAEEPLRAPNMAVDARLAEPLASQLRTMIALHEDARLILAPVNLRFEKTAAGGRAVVRILLLDARMSNVRFVGEVAGDSFPEYGPAVLASLAAHFGDVVVIK